MNEDWKGSSSDVDFDVADTEVKIVMAIAHIKPFDCMIAFKLKNKWSLSFALEIKYPLLYFQVTTDFSDFPRNETKAPQVGRRCPL